MTQTAAIFPGQGAQSVGMGRSIAEASPAARAIYQRAAEVLGYDAASVCFDGPAERLEQTDVQQPAIFVTSAALWAAYGEAGGRPQAFAAAAGLSLGEYTALYAAGALSFEAGLRLVRRRGELMQQAALAAPGGMVSLIGAGEAEARTVCERARGDDVLVVANLNCPGQVVISGSRAALERAESAAAELGLRTVPLPVAGAFHSPLMASAAAGLTAVLAETDLRDASIPVVRNVDAEHHGSTDSIRKLLGRQMTEPVLWQRCIERMVGDGARRFVEFGPGRVLTGLLRKIDRTLTVVNVNTPADIEQLAGATAG